MSPDPTPSGQVLDLTVIDVLLDLGGPELLAELIELFLEDAPQRMTSLEMALHRSDAKGVRDAAHALKSSSANLGALLLSGVCRDLEEAALCDDLARIGQLSDGARTAFCDVDFALRRLLD